MTFGNHPIHPHGKLEQLEENLWRVVGDIPKMALKRQMILARANDGRILVHNAVALDESLQRQVEQLGVLTWLVVPNGYHRMDALAYKTRYPDMKVVAPRGSKAKIEEKLNVDLTYDQVTWPKELSMTHIGGIAEKEGVLTLESKRGTTLVFNDLIFNQPHLPGVFGFFYKLFGQSGTPKVTLISRLAIVKDKREVAAELKRLAETPSLIRLIPAHIDPIVSDVAEELQRVARRLV